MLGRSTNFQNGAGLEKLIYWLGTCAVLGGARRGACLVTSGVTKPALLALPVSGPLTVLVVGSEYNVGGEFAAASVKPRGLVLPLEAVGRG